MFSKSTLGAVWGTDQRDAVMEAKRPGRSYCSNTGERCLQLEQGGSSGHGGKWSVPGYNLKGQPTVSVDALAEGGVRVAARVECPSPEVVKAAGQADEE